MMPTSIKKFFAPPTALHYNPTLSLWLSVDPLSDKYPNLSPYVYCGNNPIAFIDPDGRDWFENEKTGDVYYSRDYHKGDEHLIDGEGWKWMGKNGMFGKSDNSVIADHFQQAEVFASDEEITRAAFSGDNAKIFMEDMGYAFRTKTASVKVIETTTMVSEPHEPVYLTTVDESIIRRTGTYTKNKFEGSYNILSYGPIKDKKIGLVTKQSIHTEIREYDYTKKQVNRNITSSAVKVLGEVLKLRPLVK